MASLPVSSRSGTAYLKNSAMDYGQVASS